MKYLLLLILITASNAEACRVKLLPHELSEYKLIYKGEVVGIKLTEYTKRRQSELKKDTFVLFYTDVTEAYEVEVLPTKVYSGSVSSLQSHLAEGCGVKIPDVREVGLFFVSLSGKFIPIYASETDYYQALLDRLESEEVSQDNKSFNTEASKAGSG